MSDTAVIVCAYDEAERLPATLAALRASFPNARLLVADDHSADATPTLAVAAGAELVRAPRRLGKGGAATLAAARLLADPPPVTLLCDGDLADSARELAALAAAVRGGDADLAVGAFARRAGGGFGWAVGFARWSLRRRTGLSLAAPISGQRALSPAALRASVPFAARFGMEVGMTTDVARAGLVVREIPLELEHRATGRTVAGFAHRGRQLLDFAAVHLGLR